MAALSFPDIPKVISGQWGSYSQRMAPLATNRSLATKKGTNRRSRGSYPLIHIRKVGGITRGMRLTT